MSAWLHIVGIGPALGAGLSPMALESLKAARTIICPERYHGFADGFSARVIPWREEYASIESSIEPYRGPDCTPVVMLVTGDPLWFSAGSVLADRLAGDDMIYHPQISAFQLAASRLHWPLDDTICASVLGSHRPAASLLPHLTHRARILALSSGSEATGAVIDLLITSGFGTSEVTLLGEMGYKGEIQETRTAAAWNRVLQPGEIPAFHVIAIACRAPNPAVPATRAPGLPDGLYDRNRKFTRSEVRAVTVAALEPSPHRVMWDLGTGMGSVAIEWLRLAGKSVVHAVDRDPERIAAAMENAHRLGAPSITFLTDSVQSAAETLTAAPDVVFIGGGLSHALVDTVMARLATPGRLVVNAVTLESESILTALHKSFGGELVRIGIARTTDVGHYRGWKQFMPVTQWRFRT